MFRGRGRNEPKYEVVELKDAVAFWQREVHYYEGRAGEQGASANRLVTIVAGAVAVASLVSAGLERQTLSPLLLVVPAVVLVMWATATRLLHEMEILRAYREHAEWRLVLLTRTTPSLAPYRSWAELGSLYDMPPVITWTWLSLTGGISLAGTAGVLVLLAPVLGCWAFIPWAVLLSAVVALVLTFRSNARDSDRVRADLGLPPRA